MQLSTRGRYAVTAMVDIAARQTLGCECGPVCLAQIAERQKLSHAYLEQLFGKLRRAGLVASARGPGGGTCQTDELWAELGRRIQGFLGAVTLADVLAGRLAAD